MPPEEGLAAEVKPGISKGRIVKIKTHGSPATMGKIVTKPVSFLICSSKVNSKNGNYHERYTQEYFYLFLVQYAQNMTFVSIVMCLDLNQD